MVYNFRQIVHVTFNIRHGVPDMVHKHSDIHVKLYNISHQCSLCGYNMGRISESTCEMFDYSDTNSGTSGTEHSILVCKECSVRRRKRNIRGYVDLRFAELSLELAVITELRRELSSARAAVRVAPNNPADLDALWADDADTPEDIASIPASDPRLDPSDADFDEALYSRWLDT